MVVEVVLGCLFIHQKDAVVDPIGPEVRVLALALDPGGDQRLQIGRARFGARRGLMLGG